MKPGLLRCARNDGVVGGCGWLATLALLVFLAAIAPPAAAETRIALLIGNGAYEAAPLGSPKEDAKAIEAKLKALGFQVTRKTDLGRDDLQKAIREFGDRLKQPGTVGVFFYSGHGMQVNNRNYMVPTGVDIRDEDDVVQFGVEIDHVLQRMGTAGSNPNIVILDACRNNPFEKRFKSAQDGLAPMRPPTSTLIAFAAAPGTVAEAGAGGKLSPYTQALIESIETPGQDIIKMFQTVQNTVWQRSGYKQKPHMEISPGLPDFSFKPVIAAVPPPAPAPAPQAAPLKPAVGVHPGQTFKDCDVCPEMVVIPAGSFLMGSTENEEGRFDWESPQHRVTIARPFAIGKYEVTFTEWDACVAAGGCAGYRPGAGDEGSGRGRRPVINFSWRDAKAYVEWLAKTTGKAYRLPSEAEWEYAARAGTTTRYAWGDAITPKNANYGESKLGKTTEVGAYSANPWGLHDVHGNVWEWVEDVWHDSYQGAPSDGSVWTDGEGINSSRYRVCRGGSWHGDPRFLRSAYRYGLGPEARHRDLGFRVARTLD